MEDVSQPEPTAGRLQPLPHPTGRHTKPAPYSWAQLHFVEHCERLALVTLGSAWMCRKSQGAHTPTPIGTNHRSLVLASLILGDRSIKKNPKKKHKNRCAVYQMNGDQSSEEEKLAFQSCQEVLVMVRRRRSSDPRSPRGG